MGTICLTQESAIDPSTSQKSESANSPDQASVRAGFEPTVQGVKLYNGFAAFQPGPGLACELNVRGVVRVGVKRPARRSRSNFETGQGRGSEPFFPILLFTLALT